MKETRRIFLSTGLPIVVAAALAVAGCTKQDDVQGSGPQQDLQRAFRAIAGAFDPNDPPVERYIHRLEDSLKKASDNQSKAIAHHKLGLATTYDESDITLEEPHFQSALESARTASYRKGEAAAIAALAMREECKGNADKAREQLRQAIKIHEELGLKPELATDYVNLGMVDGNRGDAKASIESIDKGLGLAREANYELGVAVALANLCAAEARAGDLKKAKDAYDSLQQHRFLVMPYFLYYREMIATSDMPPVPKEAETDKGLMIVKAKDGERQYYGRALLRFRESREEAIVPCGFVEAPYFLP
jgi:tetratricopeptide (TPR) repeat protein